ncbi:MAG: MobF family relaxase [Marinoscillum sp.]
MLGIHKSYNSEAAVQYFTSSLTTEGYYLKDDISSFWSGKTAQILGYEGKVVTQDDFASFARNEYPETKNRITPRNALNRRSGFDLTFSAPKSVSVALSILGDERIENAHKLAYKAAMAHVEHDMQTQQNSRFARGYEQTSNILYAPFDHYTTRPCEVIKDGKKLYISDPQLHTHCYMMNFTHSKENNRFQALEIGNIHALAPFYESIYHSILSKELNKAGYQTRLTPDRFELHIDKPILERFSNRSKDIEKYAKDNNITDPAKLAELGTKTRHAKGKALKESELKQHWIDRLSKSELDHLNTLRGKSFERPKPVSPEIAVDMALNHLLERNSVAQEKRVIAEALRLSYGDLLYEDIATELGKRDNILKSEDGTISYVTTKEIVQAENKMQSLAVAGKGMQKPVNPNYKIKCPFLSKEQGKAIKDTLSSNDQVTILKGAAGVGKTTCLVEIREAAQVQGLPVFATAPSSAAVSVLREKGFDADTIAGLLTKPDSYKQFEKGVLIVDEAGMCGVETMSSLLSLGTQAKSRVILSGDTRQLHSVEAGDALRLLQNRTKLQTTHINQIIRQKPELFRKAIKAMSEGNSLKGYQALDKIGAVKEIPELDQRLSQMCDEFVKSKSQGRSALMVSPTNYETDLINILVREKLKKKGMIKGKEHVFETLKNLSFTEVQKQHPVNYQQDNHVIRFVKHQPGFKAGSHHVVVKTDQRGKVQVKDLSSGQISTLPLERSENWQVYQQTKTHLMKGDSIQITNNMRTTEGNKINNGNVYRIKNINKNGITLDNGKTIPKDIYHMKHSYCSTVHGVQGKDCQDVFISMSDMSFAATNEASLYVAASRGSEHVSLFTSSKDDLKKAIQKSSKRISATEIAERLSNQTLKRQQVAHHRSINEKIREHGRHQQKQNEPSRGVSWRSPQFKDRG